jgi:hypothetical protein
LSRYNTAGEIDYVLESLPGIVDTLRELSPFVGEEERKASTACPGAS